MLLVQMAAMATDLAVITTNALAITESTVIQLGPIRTALEELAQSNIDFNYRCQLSYSLSIYFHHLGMLLGLVMFKTPTMLTQLLSALTKVYVIARVVNANASLTTKVLLAKELSAQIDAVMLVSALPKSNLPPRLTVSTVPHGMLRSK